jgi:hypothetical protein
LFFFKGFKKEQILKRTASKSNELLLLLYHGVLFDTVQVDSSVYDDISDRFISIYS